MCIQLETALFIINDFSFGGEYLFFLSISIYKNPSSVYYYLRRHSPELKFQESSKWDVMKFSATGLLSNRVFSNGKVWGFWTLNYSHPDMKVKGATQWDISACVYLLLITCYCWISLNKFLILHDEKLER